MLTGTAPPLLQMSVRKRTGSPGRAQLGGGTRCVGPSWAGLGWASLAEEGCLQPQAGREGGCPSSDMVISLLVESSQRLWGKAGGATADL